MATIFVMAIKENKPMSFKHHKTKYNGALFLLMILNYIEGGHKLNIMISLAFNGHFY